MAGLMPAYILREWNNDGKLLVGGKIWFYQSGTLTPKTVYTDFTLSTALPNPVVLDAGAAADIWLGDGAYRVLITDLNDVQVRSPIDGITGAGGGAIDASSNASLAILKTYSDVRTLTTVPDVVYVTGRSVEGDGGAGLFQLQPTSTETDDDGVVLVATAGAHVYKRVSVVEIDPRWYGVTYGTATNQSAALFAAYGGSARHNVPATSAGPVYLAANIVVPVGAVAHFGEDSFLHAGASVSIEFQAGTKLSGDGVVFGDNIIPIIGASVCDALRLRWFGGDTPDDAVAKLINASTDPYTALIDRSLTLAASFSFPSHMAVDFVGGSVLSIASSTVSVTIKNLIYRGFGQIFSYPNQAGVGAIDIGKVVFLEWFGGVANDNAADNILAFHCCVKAGHWTAAQASYHLGSSYTAASALEITGDQTTVNIEAGAAIILADATVVGIVQAGAGSLTSSTRMNVESSTLVNPGRLGACQDSVISAMSGQARGNIIDSAISGSFAVALPDLEFVGSTFVAVGPLITDIGTAYHLTVRDCDLRAVESLLYTVDTAVVVDVINCRGTGVAYTNGFATVNVVGSEAANPTATTINGIECKGTDVGVIMAPQVITAPPTFLVSHAWFGFVGGQVLDGESIITQADMTLANPAVEGATNTLRYRRGSGEWPSEYGLLALAYYGGYIDLEIMYPLGVTPDPAARLIAQLVRPKLMYSSAAHSQTDVPLCAHNVYGNVVGFSASAPGTYRTRTCVWGGLTQVAKPTLAAGVSVRDEWNDTVINFGDVIIDFYESMRIVIGSSTGTGVVPAGTRIKCTLVPSLPRRQAFDTFFAEAPKATTLDGGAFEPQALAYRDIIGSEVPHLFVDRIKLSGTIVNDTHDWLAGCDYSYGPGGPGPNIHMPAFQFYADAEYPAELKASPLTLEMRVAGLAPSGSDSAERRKLFALHRMGNDSYQSQYYCP